MSIAICGKFLVAVLSPNVIAEKASGLGVGMRDQGFFLGEFQMECLSQVRSQLVLDLHRLSPCSRKTKQDIVCIADVAQSSVAGIIGIS